MIKLKHIVFAAMGALLLPSCDFMYDDPEEAEEEVTEGHFAYVDATSYAAWTYIDLSAKKATTVSVDDEENVPAEWDFALHRYNCKTNGGAVMETEFSSLDDLTKSGALPSGSWTEDVLTDSTVVVDASHMMEGQLVYQTTNVNTVFSRWMTLDTSNMPPTYTTSDRVYLLRLADETIAAVRFTDYMDASGAKGYISFDYIYPLEL